MPDETGHYWEGNVPLTPAHFSINITGRIADNQNNGLLPFNRRYGNIDLARCRSDYRILDPQARAELGFSEKPPETATACDVFCGAEYPEKGACPKERDRRSASTDHQEDDGETTPGRIPRHSGSFRNGVLPRPGSRILRPGRGVFRLHPRCRSRIPSRMA